jgi:hypothetical protein
MVSTNMIQRNYKLAYINDSIMFYKLQLEIETLIVSTQYYSRNLEMIASGVNDKSPEQIEQL